MTDLIDRYLAAVARELPEAQRADITAELRDELMSGLEAREEGLGRALTREELEAALIEFGNPLVVAGRYRKVQHLIGPEVFPFWWAGLRATLLVMTVVYVVLAVLSAIAGGEAVEIADRAAPSLLVALVFAFGVVTLVCAAVERFGKPGTFGKWKPGNLPPAAGRTRGRFEIMAEIGMDVVVVLWWAGLVHFRNVLPVVHVRVEMAPVWAAWFWPILVFLVAEIAVNLLALLRPGRVRLNGGLAIGRYLTGAAILTGVMQAGQIVVVSAAHLRPDVLATIQANFDKGFRIGLAVTILLFLWQAGTEAWRLRQFLRYDASPPSRPV